MPRIEASPQYNAAARDLVISLADMTSTTLLSRGFTAPNRLLRANLNRLLRALTAVSHVSGGRVSLTWGSPDALQVNGVALDLTDPNTRGALRLLRQHFGGRGVDGLVLQGQLKGEQVQSFLHQLKPLDAAALRALGGEQPTVTLAPDLLGLRLVFAPPTPPAPPPPPGRIREDSSAPRQLQGLLNHPLDSELLSQGTERLLRQPDRAWRTLGLPPVNIVGPEPFGSPTLAQRRLMALTAYTHAVTFAEQLLDRPEGSELPIQALQRLILHLDRAHAGEPHHLIASVLLGAVDASPHRRAGHALIWTVGLARELGATTDQLVSLGLAVMMLSLTSTRDDVAALSLLPASRAMHPEEIEAFRLATEAIRGPREEQSTMARLIGVAVALAALLDGRGEAPGPRPWVEVLNRLQADGHDPGLINGLLSWLGALPAGAIVTLLDGRIAVAGPRADDEVTVYPILDGDQLIEPTPTTLSSTLREPGVAGWPAAGAVVHLAARALFQGSQGPLLLGASRA